MELSVFIKLFIRQLEIFVFTESGSGSQEGEIHIETLH